MGALCGWFRVPRQRAAAKRKSQVSWALRRMRLFLVGWKLGFKENKKSFSPSLKLPAHTLARGAVALTPSRTLRWDLSAQRGPSPGTQRGTYLELHSVLIFRARATLLVTRP